MDCLLSFSECSLSDYSPNSYLLSLNEINGTPRKEHNQLLKMKTQNNKSRIQFKILKDPELHIFVTKEKT